MANQNSNPLILSGAFLILLGVAGLAVPVFQTRQMTDVAKIGELKIQAKQDTTHEIPQMLSITALAIGVALAGLGMARKA